MEDAVRAVLRPAEKLKFVCEARDPSVAEDHRARRVLAVIVHIVESGSIPAEIEQGCLLVLKALPREPVASPPALILHDAIPITSKFDIGMAQQPSSTIDLGRKSIGSPKTELVLNIKCSRTQRSTPSDGRQLPTSEELTFVASDLEHLRELLAHCKKLKDASMSYAAAGLNANSFAATPMEQDETWPWLTPYIHLHHPSNSAEVPITYALPHDMRLFHGSPSSLASFTAPTEASSRAAAIYARLSPAHAGAPGDAAGDIEIIRDAWVRNQLLQVRGETSSTLSIHIGTFNVNGKLPLDTTDLSPWLGIASNSAGNKDDKLLPPLPKISPLNVALPEDGDDPTKTSLESAPTLTERVVDLPVPTTSSPDVIVLGFQELDLSTAALIYSTDKTKEDTWTKAVMRTLNGTSSKKSNEDSYVKLASKQLVGMLIMIFVRAPLVPRFTGIHTSSVGSGIIGMGNKGGVAIRLSYTPEPAPFVEDPEPETPKQATFNVPAHTPSDPADIPLPPSATSSTFPSSRSSASIRSYSTDQTSSDSSDIRPFIMTFVNAHLAAFDEQLERRNADFAELSRRLLFDVSVPIPGFKPSSQAIWPPQEPTTTVVTNIYQSDALFWMGDLNYRIDLPDSQVRELLGTAVQNPANKLGEESFELLQKHDQLKKSQRDGKAFVGFNEMRIGYMPTYRYNPGLATDALGYDAKRKPAWTDRIFHMAAHSSSVLQSSYAGHLDITQSDHRPVSADFDVTISQPNTNHYDRGIQNLWRKVASLEEVEDAPELELSNKVIELGIVKYDDAMKVSFTVKNTGRVPSVWRLVAEEGNANPVQPWMVVDPPCGLLLPGEQSVINVRVHVTQQLAAQYNLGSRRLESTLIVRAILGRDYFIAIGGDYEPTVFGNSLDTLSRLPGSIRKTKGVSELKDPDKARGNAKEVMKLIGWLMDNASDEEGLFVTPGHDALVNLTREALDNDVDLPAGSNQHETALAIASTLISFLQSLSPPLVPPAFHSQLVTAMDREDAYSKVAFLPPASVNIWMSLNAFLHYHVRQRTSNVDDSDARASQLADDLVAVLAPVFMPDGDSLTPITPAAKRQFLKYFITD